MDVSLSSFLNQIFKQHVQFILQENTSLSEAFQGAGDIWKIQIDGLKLYNLLNVSSTQLYVGPFENNF